MLGQHVFAANKTNHGPVKHRVTVGSSIVNNVQLVSGYEPFKKTEEETINHEDYTEYWTGRCAQSQGTLRASSIRAGCQGIVGVTYFWRRSQTCSSGLECTWL